MTYENLEILQANNLHLFHNNSILNNKVEQLKSELESMQKLLKVVCRCLSRELLEEIEGQITAISLQLVNLNNASKIDSKNYNELSDLLTLNKNLLSKILDGKNDLEATLNKQLEKIMKKDKKILDLEKDVRHSRNQFIKLIDKNLESISNQKDLINKLETENKTLQDKILNQKSLISDLYNKLEKADIFRTEDEYLILPNKVEMLSEIGKYKISIVPGVIICFLITVLTSAITYRSKNIHLSKHQYQCSFCAQKYKNK